MDCWHDANGRPQWSVRVVTKSWRELDDGELKGNTADGRAVSGQALVAERQIGPGGRREMLIVFHGTGILTGPTPPLPG
jgi:hypothetical protein